MAYDVLLPPWGAMRTRSILRALGAAFATAVPVVLNLLVSVVAPADATLLAVTGPTSSAGTAPAIVAAPAHALDDVATNTGMQGFDEAQGVATTVAHGIDNSGVIPIGTLVSSHMIFLNSAGVTALTHGGVVWTFDGIILGVMSDSGGLLEAASTFELKNPATNYTLTFPGSGPAAPFPARGLEGGGDAYSFSGNTLTVSMSVTEPGDWIRVVTAAPVPEPPTLLLLVSGLVALWGTARRMRRVRRRPVP